MDQEPVLVTVICLAFNHEKYVAQALEGTVNQETDFRYEVLVHDDASTDKTAEIIREYEQKYPEIIHAIYQKENQYSQNVDVYAEFLSKIAQGKYIALCEGDDLWCDTHKLQMQVEAMQQNPGCKMSVHAVAEVNSSGIATGAVFPKVQLKTGVLSSREFLSIGKEYNFQTSSYMFDAENFWQYKLNVPDFAKECDVGDELYMLYFAQLGDVYFIDRVMSHYRRGVAGSWSDAQRRGKIRENARHHELMVGVLKKYDQYTNHKYHDLCAERIGRQMAIACVLSGTAKSMFQDDNLEYFQTLSSAQKWFIRCARICPKLMCKVYIDRRQLQDKKHGMALATGEKS